MNLPIIIGLLIPIAIVLVTATVMAAVITGRRLRAPSGCVDKGFGLGRVPFFVLPRPTLSSKSGNFLDPVQGHIYICAVMTLTHLHTHSSFSFHAGVSSVHDIVGRARDLEMPAVGLTDTDRMSGLILHYEACHTAGIRPILGVEFNRAAAGRGPGC